MKFTHHVGSCVLRGCAVICLAAASVCAQSQSPLAILELTTGCYQVQVFEDSTVVKSRYGGKKTQRRLSAERMSKLREVIARGPCEQLWQSAKPELDYSGDCMPMNLSYIPPVLQMVHVTRRYPGFESRIRELYLPCDRARVRDRKARMRGAQRYINPSWQRFLKEVDATIGGQSFIKDCVCGPPRL